MHISHKYTEAEKIGKVCSSVDVGGRDWETISHKYTEAEKNGGGGGPLPNCFGGCRLGDHIPLHLWNRVFRVFILRCKNNSIDKDKKRL